MSPNTSSFELLATLAVAPESPTAAQPSEADNGTGATLDWLMAWLGEMTESPDAEAEPAAQAQRDIPAQPEPQTQWLALLPATVVFQPPVEDVQAAQATIQVVAPKVESWGFNNDEPTAADSEENTAPNELPATATEQSIPVVLTGVPVVTPPTSPSAPDAPTSEREPGLVRPSIFQRGASAVGERADPGFQTTPAPVKDKGEIIWSAELVVREAPAIEPPAQSAVAERKIPEKANAAELGRRVIPEPDLDDRSRSSGDAPHRDSDPKDAEAKAETPPRQDSRDVTRLVRGEESTQLEPAQSEPVRMTSASATRGDNKTSIPSEVRPEDTQLVEAAAEPARALRPSQVSTVRVDLPAHTGEAESAPMRLVITQRGAQVNVHLRSWDSSTQPLEAERMQPLLHKLANHGLDTKPVAAESGADGLAGFTERQAERAPTSFEGTAGTSDQSIFHGQEQRREQERGRQQQAMFLRRQLRQTQREEFDLQAALNTTSVSFF